MTNVVLMGWSGFRSVRRGATDSKHGCTPTPTMGRYIHVEAWKFETLIYCIQLRYLCMKILQIIRRMHKHNHNRDAAAVEVAAVKTAIKRRAEDKVEVWCSYWNILMVTIWWKLIAAASADHYTCGPGPTCRLCGHGGALKQQCSPQDHPAEAQPDSCCSTCSTQLSRFSYSSQVPGVFTCCRTRLLNCIPGRVFLEHIVFPVSL